MAENTKNKRLKYRDWSVRRKITWWVLAIIIIGFFVWIQLGRHYRSENWETTTAVVTYVGRMRYSGTAGRSAGTSSRDITFEFEVDNALFNSTRNISETMERRFARQIRPAGLAFLQISDAIPIHFDPTDPNAVRLGRAEDFAFTLNIGNIAWLVALWGGILLFVFHVIGIIGTAKYDLKTSEVI